MTHASRNTITGLAFEGLVKGRANGIEVSKHELYRLLEKRGINWKDFLSRKLLPDECYWDEDTKTLSVFEKKVSAK